MAIFIYRHQCGEHDHPLGGGEHLHEHDEELTTEEFLGEGLRILEEEGEGVLKIYLESHPDQWEDLLENLSGLEEEQRIVIEELQREVSELQQQVIEWLPEYPVSKKILIIINGDSAEERHRGNTENAIRILRAQGFEEIYVAQDSNVRDDEGVRQYTGDKKGLDALFADLPQSLQEDALVFVYGTGHGTHAEGGGMSVTEPIGIEEVQEYMEVIRDNDSRIIGVFDNCYSGAFPYAIVNETGLEGIVMSPGIEGKETACQFFAPYFFEGIEEGLDLNTDGVTQVSEIFVAAMQIYRQRTETEEYGEYMRSKVELTTDNFDVIMGGDKPVLIDINTTWCGYCKELSHELSRLSGVIGEQIHIVTITADVNPDTNQLYEMLGLEERGINVVGFPTLLLKNGDDIEHLHQDLTQDFHALGEALTEKTGVKPNEGYAREKILEEAVELGFEREAVEAFVGYYGIENADLLGYLDVKKDFYELVEAIQGGDEDLINQKLEKVLRRLYRRDISAILIKYYPLYKDAPFGEEFFKEVLDRGKNKNIWAVLKYHEYYADKPYAEEMLQQAVRNALILAPEEAIEFYDLYRDKPYAEQYLRKAVEQAPYEAVQYFNSYKDEPYSEELLRQSVEGRSLVAVHFYEHYKDKPYAEEVLGTAVRNASEKPGTAWINLIYHEYLEGKPYGEEGLEASVRILLESDILDTVRSQDTLDPKEYLLKNFYAYKDKPYAMEILGEIGKENPVLMLRHYEEYQDQPYAQDLVTINVNRLLIDKGDWRKVLSYYPLYKDRDYADSVIDKIFRGSRNKNPYLIASYPEIFKDRKPFERLIWKALRANDFKAFLIAGFILENFEKYSDLPHADELLEQCVRIDLGQVGSKYNVITNYETYADKPYAEEILREATSQEPEEAMRLFKYYAEAPYAEEILEISVREVAGRSARRESYLAVDYYEVYQGRPYADEVLEESLEENPFKCLSYYEMYQDKPFADKMLKKGARAMLDDWSGSAEMYFFMYYHLFSDRTYAEEFLEEEVKKASSFYALQYYPLYKDKPYAAEVSQKAAQGMAEQHPDAIFDNIPFLESIPHVNMAETLKYLAQNNPDLVIENSWMFEEKPYAREVIDIANSTQQP